MIHPLTFLKGVGIGAGLMYLLDPDRGNQRRAQIRDQFNSAMSSCESCLDATMRDVQNRWQGVTHDINHLMSSAPADDHKLSARVRSTMGRYVSHPGAIDVDVRDGCVCLSGPILADEVQPFVRAIKGVPGVQQVDNKLEVHHSPAGVSALQGGTPRPGERFELMQENWAPATRLMMTGLGAGLVANCLVRRSPMATILGTVGFGLLARSTSNEPIERLVGLPSRGAPRGQHATPVEHRGETAEQAQTASWPAGDGAEPTESSPAAPSPNEASHREQHST